MIITKTLKGEGDSKEQAEFIEGTATNVSHGANKNETTGAQCSKTTSFAETEASSSNDNVEGKVIDLDEMTAIHRESSSAELGDTDTTKARRSDKYVYSKPDIEYFSLKDTEFMKRTEQLRKMREDLINNLNKNVEKINKQYEGRKNALFKMAEENGEIWDDDQFRATKYLEKLFGSGGSYN